MADPTLVNGQITDAIAQAGVTALGHAPAQSLAAEFQAGAHATGLAIQNATANQRQATTLSASTTTQALAQLFTLPSSQAARATVQTFTVPSVVNELAALSSAILALRRNRPQANRPGPHVASPNLVASPFEEAQPGPSAPPTSPPAPSDDVLVGLIKQLAEAIERLARALRTLAATRMGDHRMSDTEPLGAIRAAADRLNTLLEELSTHLTAGPPPELWRRLCDALDDLRRASRSLEDRGRPAWCQQPAPPPVPVGATPPNVVIVGSGNASYPAPRVVGASW